MPLRSLSLVLALSALLVSACGRSPIRAAFTPPPARLTYAADLERARELGWIAGDTENRAALEELAARVQHGLDAASEGWTTRVIAARGHIRIDLVNPLTSEEAELVDRWLTSQGGIQFRIVANAQDLGDLAAEQRRMEAWRAANPDALLATFNALAPKAGGPDDRIAWFPTKPPEGEAADALPVLRPVSLRDSFGSGDMAKVYFTADEYGYPSVGFELSSLRKPDFAEMTGRNVNRQMAVLVAEEIVSSPMLEERLPGKGIIRGRFTDVEVRDLVDTLRGPSGGVFQLVGTAPR